MAHARVRFATVLACLGLSGMPVGAQQAAEGTVYTRTLRNGMNVVVIPSRVSPFATVRYAVRAGAFTQLTPRLQGLPHLLEHMVFQQEERAFARSNQQRMNDIDASSNASTSDEAVSYYHFIPSKHVTKGIELMADMIRRVDITQEAITAEARAVRGELQRVASEPDAMLLTNADRQLWSDAGWERKNAGGNLLSVQDASPQLLKDMHAKYYVPNNSALFVSGDVQPDSVFAVAERVFGDWRATADPLADVPPLDIPPLAAISRNVFAASVRDVTFMVRWQGPSVGIDPGATYAADVFASLVNQPLSGTQKRLVETGLFQSVSFGYSTRRFVGSIALVARTTPERAVAAAGALGQELRRLVDTAYFNAEDLAFARRRDQVATAFAKESAHNYETMLADLWASSDLAYTTTYTDSLATRGPADVRRFVETYVKGKNFAVTVMLSPEALTGLNVRLRNSLNAWRVP